MKIKVGTRGSKLALHQTRQVIDLIKKQQPDCEVEEVIIKTLGDQVTGLPLFKVGGQGLFIKEIEQALLDRKIDLAVHSLKDVPHQIADGLELPAFGLPQDARDCFLSRDFSNLAALPAGSIVGTSSLRRRSQLARIRPDLVFSDFRGNLDTRLKKLEEGEVDAIILAAAGLLRFDQADKIGEYFPVSALTPPAGQGLIAVECRIEDRDRLLPLLQKFACPASRQRALCERAFLREIQGGCQTPMAAHAIINGDSMTIHSYIGTPDGIRAIRRSDSGPASEPDQLGRRAALAVIADGGLEMLNKPTQEKK
ncbi:MAG: hydroxymethylbilane synthase [Candidatus Riflebacteria bacterium]